MTIPAVVCVYLWEEELGEQQLFPASPSSVRSSRMHAFAVSFLSALGADLRLGGVFTAVFTPRALSFLSHKERAHKLAWRHFGNIAGRKQEEESRSNLYILVGG